MTIKTVKTCFKMSTDLTCGASSIKCFLLFYTHHCHKLFRAATKCMYWYVYPLAQVKETLLQNSRRNFLHKTEHKKCIKL